MSDLMHLRDHEKQQAMLNWKVSLQRIWNRPLLIYHQMHRDELADGMTAENRHKLSQLQQERTALKRDRMTLPNLRDGRGGGGWAFYDKHLLSTGEQRRAPINVAGQERQRRSVSLAVRGATLEDAEKDLVLLGLRKAKKQTRSPSPPPPHRPTAHLPPQPVEHHRTPLPPPWPTSVSNSKRYDMYRPPSRHEVPASNRNDKYAEDRLDHRKVYAPPPEAYHPTPASYEYYPHALVQDQHRERDRMEREKQRERERRKAAIPVPPPSRQKYDYWAAPPSLPAKGRNDLVIPPYNPMGTGRDMAPPPPPRVKP